MSPTLVFDPADLETIGIGIFESIGTPGNEARTVASHLVETSLMGHESHGVTRIICYIDLFKEGLIKPGAPVTIEKQTPSTAIVDGRMNFGQVCAYKMADIAIEKTKESGVSCVVSRHFNHTGRFGAYTEKMAKEGLIAIATITAPKDGYWVTPFGGREARLATNPISWAAPKSGDPVVLDMTTCASSHGKVVALQNAGQEVPLGQIIDSAGNPSTRPEDLLGPPRGAILPFGGEMGYKAFGMSLLTMVLGSTLIDEAITDEIRYVNGLALIGIDPEKFSPLSTFIARMDEFIDFIKETPTAEGVEEILIPGELEYRSYEKKRVEGIPLPQATWDEICGIAHEFNVEIPEPQKTID